MGTASSDFKRIQQAKTARENAEQIFAEIADLYGDQPLRFWEVLGDLVAAKLPPKAAPPSPVVLTRDEAESFKNTVAMPRGIYAGQLVCNVPADYLEHWVADDPFASRLRRYVYSPHFEDHETE